jgi:hypothetical protein
MGKYTYKHLGHKLFQTPGVVDESKIVEVTLDPVSVTAKAMDRARKARESKAVKKADGGSMKKKFPDLSGDGKITKKDILMGRGVIKARRRKNSNMGADAGTGLESSLQKRFGKKGAKNGKK